MNIFSDDDDVKEVLIEDIVKSEDNGKIILPTIGDRGEGKDNLTKEIIAHDALVLGPSEAARIHGIDQASASRYKDGKDIADPDTRANVLATKNNIADKAIAKLMDSLNLFDPNLIEKPIDHAKSAAILAGVVEKMTQSGKNTGQQVILNLYAPKQRPMSEYQVIEVS